MAADSLKKRITDYIDRRMFADARNLLVQQLDNHPMDLEAKMLLGRVYAGEGKAQAAFEAFAEIEHALVDLSISLVHLGDIYRNRGMNREARDCYHRFLELNPESAMSEEISMTMNSLTVNDEQYKGNNHSTNEAAELAPEFYTITLADLYIKQGHLDMACEVLEKILTRDPANEDAAIRLRELKPDAADPADNSKKERIISKLNGWLKSINSKKAQPMVQ